jgi:hypothetical protein
MELTEEHYRRAAIAYDAYCKQTGGKSLVTGDTLPAFDALRPAIKDAWAASAIALSLDAEIAVRRCDGREWRPLRAAVENNQLSFAVGVRMLAFAFENGEENNPYDGASCDTKRQVSISEPWQFAKDVCHELNREGEDGSTPLTRFLDSMMGEAVNQGSLGIHYPDEATDSLVPEGK